MTTRKSQQQLFIEGLLLGTTQQDRVKNHIPISINYGKHKITVSNNTTGAFLLWSDSVSNLWDSVSSNEDIQNKFNNLK